jgi:ubiquinol-cytochrome c reductase cytochrome c subunit
MRTVLRRALLIAASVSALTGGLLLVVLLGQADAGESGGVGVQEGGTVEPDPPEELSPAEAQRRANDDPEMLVAGEQLYLTGCVSCHGVDGVGTPEFPALRGVGAASADFYLRTGRMPLAYPVPQPPQKAPAYDDEEIRALVAYVNSLGCSPPEPGFACPQVPDVDPGRGDRSEGLELFLSNCAPCHQSAAIGGALSQGRHAPPLLDIGPVQIGEAMRVGPGQMPVFAPETITDEQMDSIINYILYLQAPESPGGLRIGSVGPVTEGLVAWLVGLGLLMLIIRWITKEAHG